MRQGCGGRGKLVIVRAEQHRAAVGNWAAAGAAAGRALRTSGPLDLHRRSYCLRARNIGGHARADVIVAVIIVGSISRTWGSVGTFGSSIRAAALRSGPFIAPPERCC